MFIRKLIIGLLSFYAVEVKRSSIKKDEGTSLEIRHERLYEIGKRREAKKRKTKTYDNRKWKKKTQFKERSFKISGTQPKDVRYSNQQKIRRMFRNC